MLLEKKELEKLIKSAEKTLFWKIDNFLSPLD